MLNESEARIKQAIAAYEAPTRGRIRFDAQNPHPYWAEIVSQLNNVNLPVPNISTTSLLDLGGGSDIGEAGGWSDTGDFDFDPVFCRYLAALGMPQIVNVDIGPQNKRYSDIYTHIQLALVTDENFSLPAELQNRNVVPNFDIITSSLLINETNPSPTLLDKGIDPRQLRSRIMEWSKELLKPNGYLFFMGGIGNKTFMLSNQELIDIQELGR